MLTIKAEIIKCKQRVDLTYNVKLRFTLGKQVKRLSTNLFAKDSDLTKNQELKSNSRVGKSATVLVSEYYEKCSKLQIELYHYSLDEIFRLLNESANQTLQSVDFIEFSRNWINNSSAKGAKNYQSALNALIEYNKSEVLDVRELRTAYLNGFMDFLNEKHALRCQELLNQGKRVTSNRMVSLYMGSIRHLFYEARKNYNDYDFGTIVIPHNPFERIEIPKQGVTRKRAISPTVIKQIFQLPYRKNEKGNEMDCVYNLAKDCFILSFCLIGMNSADLHSCSEYDGESIIYNRTKTKDRRSDEARMVVDVPPIVSGLFQKYRDPSGLRVFNFYQRYNTYKNFNRALNKGLKVIGDELHIMDLEFYAARHSWATIAANKCRVDKYTVHSALNHVDPSMKVTDIYIERDFSLENNANERVIEFVFGNY